ncbi:MAG: magnesium/cobalt transporter CorA [Candidatus Omnitrophota bacterium]
MARSIRRLSKTAGLVPGTLVHVGEKRSEKVHITIIDYDESSFHEKEIKNIEECFPYKDSPTVTWINIDGIHNVEIIEKIGRRFQLHSLVLEDILDTDQRPKMEDLDSHIFVVFKMLMIDGKHGEIKTEQVSLLLGANFVISFQENQGDVFDPIRERIRNNKGRIRKMAADYLAYSLLDTIVDSYYVIMESMGEKIEVIEDELIKNPTPQILQTIHNLKRDTLYLRRSVWPLREVVNRMERGESELIKETTHIFLRDVYDHTVQVIDTIETFRDIVSGMLDIYLSSLSHKMNEVMKVLTIIATIFIPLTFVAGIYGMNFNPAVSRWNMPELNWEFGYIAVWLVMLSVAAVMIVYFKRKKWL